VAIAKESAGMKSSMRDALKASSAAFKEFREAKRKCEASLAMLNHEMIDIDTISRVTSISQGLAKLLTKSSDV